MLYSGSPKVSVILFVPLRHFLCIGSVPRSLLITDYFDTMARSTNTVAIWALALVHLVCAQQQCYFGPGAENRGPTELVPCMNTGQSACCLLGDICLSGNTCWNFNTGNLYQYGCTDIRYEDDSCPYKCGFNSSTKVLFPIVEVQTNLSQPCRLGQPWNIASTITNMSRIRGSVTHQRAVDANGVPTQICSFCSLVSAKTWDRTPESPCTLHQRLHLMSLCLPVLAGVLVTSLQR
jgi:hypothetical protein